VSWLKTEVPLWQVMILLTVYVLYKELVKLALKYLVKYLIRRRRSDILANKSGDGRGEARGERVEDHRPAEGLDHEGVARG